MEELNQTTNAPQICPECSGRNGIQDKIAELLVAVLNKVQDQSTDVKATIPELLKLLQLNHEHQQDRVKEIKVIWITTKKQ